MPSPSFSPTQPLLSPAARITGGGPAADGTALPQGSSLDAQRFDVVMDGWSAKTLAGSRLAWQDSTGRTGTATLAPVDDAQARALLDTPEIVERISARMITPAADLSCASSGCTGTHKVDLSWFTHPSQVPVLGPEYTGYGIDALAYAAALTLDPAATSVRLWVEGSDISLTFSTVAEAGSEPTASSGYLRNRALVFASFQRLFRPDPAWLSSDSWMLVDGLPSTSASPAEALRVAQASTAAPAFSGLAEAHPAYKALTDSQLTYFSSPSTGCGVGALCTPVALHPRVEATTTPVALCQTSPDLSAPGQATSARLARTTVTVDLPAPTNQFWMWGIADPSQMLNLPAAGGASYGGLPPRLLEGQRSMHFATEVVLDADGDVHDVMGSASLDKAPPRTDAELVADFSPADAAVTLCS